MDIDKRFSSLLEVDVASQLPGALHYAVYKSEHYCYWLLALKEQQEEIWYLYASSLYSGIEIDLIEQVLGVFDTCGQLSFFLDLHEINELKVPALKINYSVERRIYTDDQGVLHYPRYAGVYRVGFKSYTVDVAPDNEAIRIVHYIQSYKTQYLGVFEEKEACLAIYSHFDKRIRGCAMC